MTVPILQPPLRRWYCPNCGQQSQTREARAHTRFHTCPRMRGLTAPMLPVGVKAKVELVEREDYVGREVVARDPERNRPVQSLVTTRDNGQDVVVFAPTATARSN